MGSLATLGRLAQRSKSPCRAGEGASPLLYPSTTQTASPNTSSSTELSSSFPQHSHTPNLIKMSSSWKKRPMHDTEPGALASPQPSLHLDESPAMSICKKQKLVHDSEPVALESPQSSRLLKLPGELRNIIYKLVFSSTRLSYGLPELAHYGPVCTKPARNSLSLLYTCRDIHQETCIMWINHVLFNFNSHEVMLLKVSKLPMTTMSELRHLRISGEPFYLDLEGFHGTQDVTALLQLFPNLRLETLTVLGSEELEVEYETLDTLINEGQGWKELRFISRDSFLPSLRIESGPLPYVGQFQPQLWNEEILARDGKDSNASVCVYR